MNGEQVLLQDGEVAIIERGRGPEVKGTRITVYDVEGYQRMDWPLERTAAWLRLTLPQVRAAIRYIDEHREQVDAAYQRGLEAAARGNPPEVQARLDAAHQRFMARLDERQRRRVEELFRDESGRSNGCGQGQGVAGGR